MFGDKRVLGLVPARGGSKGLPRKQLRELGGKPLIAWTIEAGLASETVDDVIVTCDDDEILRVAAGYGAEVPFVRPPELATDDARMIDVVKHALDALEDRGRTYDLITLLQPTSPLRGAADIDGAVRRIATPGAEAVVGVTRFEPSPLLAVTVAENGFVSPLDESALTANRQSMPVYHRINGAAYVTTPEVLRARETFVHERTVAYVMPAETSVDVDTELDLMLAQVLVARTPRP